VQSGGTRKIKKVSKPGEGGFIIPALKRLKDEDHEFGASLMTG
jgi:hypothetical protein